MNKKGPDAGHVLDKQIAEEYTSFRQTALYGKLKGAHDLQKRQNLMALIRTALQSSDVSVRQLAESLTGNAATFWSLLEGLEVEVTTGSPPNPPQMAQGEFREYELPELPEIPDWELGMVREGTR